jgi:hypothetical protein
VATNGDRMLAIFSVVTLLTIAIVCNVANLLITRGRSSAGTRASPIARGITVSSHPGLLAEGLVLSAMAWCAACLFAWWISGVVISSSLLRRAIPSRCQT